MESAELSAIADFQLVYRALTDVERDRGGRYPLRNEGLLPLTEYVRSEQSLAGPWLGGSPLSRQTAMVTPSGARSFSGSWARVRPRE